MKKTNIETKECIEKALILLMDKKPFSQISIQEIINKAGVGRSSYYRNYSSKENILESMLDSLILETAKAMGKFDFSTKGEEPWIQVLKMAENHAKEFTLLLKSGFGDKILRKIIASFENSTENTDESRITNIYISGCIYSVMTQWILDGMKTDIEKTAGICSTLMQGKTEIKPCGQKG